MGHANEPVQLGLETWNLVVRKLRKNPNCGREPSAGLDLLEWHPRDLKQAYHDFKRGLLAMDACTTIS
jgi:hypothetical protein